MRIAFANSARIWGGAEVMTERLARGMAERGHEVIVLCRPGSPFLERLPPELPCLPTLGGFDLHPAAIGRTARALRRHRTDVLMTMTQKDPRTAGVAARLVGVPVLVRHPMDIPFRRRLHHRLYYGWVPAHLVANSRATRDTMLRSAPWLRAEDVTVIHNGIDLAPVDAARPADLGLPEGAVAIGYVGRFERRKGIQDLVAAWPEIATAIPAAHLLLVGRGGALEPEARERSRDLPRVHWLGFRDDVLAVMRALDLLVAPSHQEGFGLVVAEAMASGVAVAVARATNFPELVSDGVEGLHFAPGDPADLARAVIELAGDPERRRRLGDAGARRVRSEFSLERMMDRYEALFARYA